MSKSMSWRRRSATTSWISERTYQGSALTFVWHLELGPRARRIVTVRNVVTAAHDRSAEELAALDA